LQPEEHRMMTILAKGLGWLLGSSVLPIGLAAGLLVTGHQLWLARDQKIETAAVTRCEAEHDLAIAQAKLKAAERALEDHKGLLNDERQVTEALRHERTTIRSEFAAYKAAASSDPRCLSDGVLDLLRGHDKVGPDR
jgi:hypothetical protein